MRKFRRIVFRSTTKFVVVPARKFGRVPITQHVSEELAVRAANRIEGYSPMLIDRCRGLWSVGFDGRLDPRDWIQNLDLIDSLEIDGEVL